MLAEAVGSSVLPSVFGAEDSLRDASALCSCAEGDAAASFGSARSADVDDLLVEAFVVGGVEASVVFFETAAVFDVRVFDVDVAFDVDAVFDVDVAFDVEPAVDVAFEPALEVDLDPVFDVASFATGCPPAVLRDVVDFVVLRDDWLVEPASPADERWTSRTDPDAVRSCEPEPLFATWSAFVDALAAADAVSSEPVSALAGRPMSMRVATNPSSRASLSSHARALTNTAAPPTAERCRPGSPSRTLSIRSVNQEPAERGSGSDECHADAIVPFGALRVRVCVVVDQFR